MNKSISTAIVLALSSLAWAPSYAFPPLAMQQASRENFGTKCEWKNDSSFGDHVVTLESYLPVLDGDVAALVVRTGDGGTELKQFSFQVRLNQNFIFYNVRPGVNIEYDDNGKEHQILHLSWSDFQKNAVSNRTELTYNFVNKMGHPIKVRHIIIGGHQLSRIKPGDTGVGAMDISVGLFQAIDSKSETLLTGRDFGIRVVTPGTDPLLQGLKCTFND